VSSKVEGLDNVLEALDGLAATDKLTEALGKACALVERSAKQNAPKGNGELRRSITSRIEEDKGIVYTPLEYAPYVEYGTGLFAENGKGRKEVPWVYIEGSTKIKKCKFDGTRDEIRALATNYALKMLKDELNNKGYK
jgi:phage gpG-like protein